SEMISTDIPASEVDTFVGLALKAKDQPIATLSLVPPLVNTGDPDIGLIHQKVAQAIAGSEHPVARHHKKKGSSAVTGGSIGALSAGDGANPGSDPCSGGRR